MKTLFGILQYMFGLILGVIMAVMYLLIFSPVWVIAHVLAGMNIEDVIDEWVDKTQYVFDFEQT